MRLTAVGQIIVAAIFAFVAWRVLVGEFGRHRMESLFDNVTPIEVMAVVAFVLTLLASRCGKSSSQEGRNS